MNYITLIPNSYQNAIKQVNMVPMQPMNNPLLFLTVISEALKSSLNNYAAIYLQAQKPSSPPNLPITTKNTAQITKTGNLQKVNMDVHKNEAVGEQGRKVLIVKQINVKQSKQSSKAEQQVSTTLIKRQQERAQNDNKQKRKNHQKPLKNKSNRYQTALSIKISEISLIQTAELPSFRLNPQQIQIKKEKLFLRQILEWDQNHKTNRDKRELRMLNI